jgi:hypothetical protein
LPVGESLIFGRPCLASTASSVPEVGGDFVDYVDPFNINDGYEKVVRFIDNKIYREERAAHIKANFKPRGWEDVAQDMLANVSSMIADLGIHKKPIEIPLLKAGRKYHFGHKSSVTRFIESGDAKVVHFAFDTHWYPVENFGRWMKSPQAKVEFATEQSHDEPALIVLEVSTVPWVRSALIQITINEIHRYQVRLKSGAEQHIVLEAPALDCNLALEFAVIGEIDEGPDPRKDLFFGLCSISYAAASDVISRLTLLEDIIINTQNIHRLRVLEVD